MCWGKMPYKGIHLLTGWYIGGGQINLSSAGLLTLVVHSHPLYFTEHGRSYETPKYAVNIFFMYFL